MAVPAGRKLDALLAAFEGAGFVIDEEGVYREVIEGQVEGDYLYADAADLLDRNVREVLPSATADRFLDVIRSVLERNRPEVIEYELEVKAGLRWFEGSVSPISSNEGTPDAVLWVARDITERKEREQRQLEHERKIKALLEVAAEMESTTEPQAVYDLLIDTANTVLEFDYAIVDAAEGDHLVPRAYSESIPQDEVVERTPIDDEDNLAARVFRAGETHIEDDISTSSGEPADDTYRSILTIPIGEFAVLQAASNEPGAFTENDRELGELLVSHARETLTRFKREREVQDRTAELERQYNRLEEFASIVSHDLRNPLTVAKGYLEIVGEEVDHPGIERVDEALDRMETIIEGTLALARQGQTIGETEPLDLADVARRCWGTVSNENASIEVVDEVTFYADEDRLLQVFENLFRNAIRHSDRPATVRVGRIDEDGFYVEDAGPGIPVDEREDVFEPGYTTTPGGTGFGLAIVKEIVEAHGWRIGIEDATTGGARFEITGVDFV